MILLPPSEGKATPSRGKPLDLDALVFAEQLGGARAEVLDAFDPSLRMAPTAAASKVYTGVLFQRLGLAELPARARRRVLIASALWGVVRPDDRIPAYRFPAKARLDGIGPPSSWWRPRLREAIPDVEGELVVDMRSAAYATAWKPQRATLLPVRAFTEVDGTRKAISHMAKAVRGDVARALLLEKTEPSTPEGVAEVAERAGFTVELSAAGLAAIVS